MVPLGRPREARPTSPSRRDETIAELTHLMSMMQLRMHAFLGLALALVAVAPATAGTGKSNHLAGQSSEYLKRAAQQPVDWYPWSAEAFRRAKEMNRPILLDVGATWCNWCNLMDRDTYTNASSAEFINQHFVAVKVDFDAAGPLVAQLQRAQAILNLPAGLPLTSFITPEGKLYYGAGYLPVAAKDGRPSFREAADEALKIYPDKAKIEQEAFQLELPK